MDEEIELINKYYTNGLKYKDIARKGDQFLQEFKKASDCFFQAGALVEALIVKSDKKNINFITRSDALKNYYLYEANECLYATAYKVGKYDEAIKIARKAIEHIEKAVKITDDNINLLNDETKRYLIEQKKNWALSQLTASLRELEPVGQRAIRNKDFVTALDSYRKMGELQDKAHLYVQQSELPEVYKRTEKANYYASKASTAMSLAGVYFEKSTVDDYTKDILEQFLEALKFIKTSQLANPEQDRYKDGVSRTEKNIKEILKDNKPRWFEFLTEFNDPNLIKIMRQTDNEHFKMQKAKLEIEKDKPKRFLLTFGFLLSGFLILTYAFFQIAISEISWFRFMILLFALPIIFTILGAFALRTTDSLKEENFIKLMELAFKTNIQGLKAFTDKEKKEDQ